MVIFVGFLVQQRQDAKNMRASKCAFLPSYNTITNTGNFTIIVQ
jgi:hypothetical protein